MKQVVIQRSQLVATVEDDQVFERPPKIITGLTPEEAAQRAVEDDNVRHEAWKACNYVAEGAEVYAGTCGLSQVYVVLGRRAYDQSRAPRPVLTKELSEKIQAEKIRVEREATQAEAKREANERNRSAFHWMPKACGGVDWGIEQRILAFTSKKMLCYRTGHSCYLGRGERGYSSPQLVVYHCEILDGKPQYFGRSAGLGEKKVLPEGRRFSSSVLEELREEIAEWLCVPVSKFKGWKGRATLDLRK